VALSFDTIQMVNLNTSSEFCFQGLLSPIALYSGYLSHIPVYLCVISRVRYFYLSSVAHCFSPDASVGWQSVIPSSRLIKRLSMRFDSRR